VRGGTETRLGHADHRHAELLAGASAQARPAVRIQIGVAVDDEQGHLTHAVQNRAEWRELTQVEPARLVGLGLGYHRDAVACQAGEDGIGRHDGGRPSAARRQVMHIRSDEDALTAMRASYHDLRMPGLPTTAPPSIRRLQRDTSPEVTSGPGRDGMRPCYAG